MLAACLSAAFWRNMKNVSYHTVFLVACNFCVLFIGEFAIYQVFAQMKHKLNFDAFYLLKYSD